MAERTDDESIGASPYCAFPQPINHPATKMSGTAQRPACGVAPREKHCFMTTFDQ